MPTNVTTLTPYTVHVWTVKIRLHARRRPDSNRDMADLQSAALAIWLRRHQTTKRNIGKFKTNLQSLPITIRNFTGFYQKFRF